MKKIFSLVWVAIIVAFSTCNNNNGEKYTLKPNLKQGDTYTLEYKIEMDQEVMGMNNKIAMNLGYKMKVKDINAQHDINTEFMYNHIGMTMRSAIMNLDYDSDSTYSTVNNEKEEGKTGGISRKMRDMYGNIMGAMVNKPMRVTLDEYGKVKTVTGFKEMMQSLKDSVSELAPGKDGGMDEMMNEDQIRQVFQQTFGTFPQKPVSIGEKWSNEFTQKQSGMPMKFSNTYKLVEVLQKENEAIIEVIGNISTGNNGRFSKNGMTMKLDMSGKQNGKMTIDLGTGMVKTGKINQDIKINMEMMGQKVPMTMKGTATMVGKKL